MNTRKMTTDHRCQLGLSLIEVMVAIAISLILLAGVMQIFLSSKTSYRLLEATSRVQENGRFAIGFINDDVRMAGFLGCHKKDLPYQGISNVSYDWDYTKAIEGNEGTNTGWSPALNTLVSGISGVGQIVDGTDVLVTRGVASDSVNVVSSTSTELVAINENNINNGDIMVVSNCLQSEVFQVTSHAIVGNQVTITRDTSGSPGNSEATFNYSYGADAQLGRLVTNIYYIGTGASGSPALFRISTVAGGVMSDPPQELVDDVEDMQVLYGIDTGSDGIANRYVTANNAGNMANVVSVRISLLLRSQNNIASAPQGYTYNGVTVTAEDLAADDLRVRRIFNTTVKIRNRGAL